MEAEVAHHGDDDGVVGQPTALVQVDGADGDDLVAVDEPAGVVDGEHPVGVTVEREPDVGALGDAPPRQRAGMRSTRTRR